MFLIRANVEKMIMSGSFLSSVPFLWWLSYDAGLYIKFLDQALLLFLVKEILHFHILLVYISPEFSSSFCVIIHSLFLGALLCDKSLLGL